MWTPTTRKQHIRKTNRYQTDVTDKEWRVIEPHLPAANITGRPRVWPMREIINGIFYVMRAGCPWRLLPSDLPPWSTIYRWFATFRDEGRFEKINHALVMLDRERVAAFKDESERAPESYRVAEAALAAAAQTFDDLCKRILTLRPETLAGLGTLALATAAMMNTTGVYDHEPHEREVDEEFVTTLIEAVTRLAGVAIPFDTAV
jgi:transposase